MKKILIIFLLVILSGCELPLTETQQIELHTQAIANAIVEKDEIEFKELFADNVIHYYNDFDEKMNEVLNYVDGTLVEARKTSYSSSGYNHYGFIKKYFRHSIEIKTSLHTYTLYVIVCNSDDIDDDNIGFHHLRIRRADFDNEEWINIGNASS
ncbi:MAG: DUF5104 domain-containing protein [bacterium]